MLWGLTPCCLLREYRYFRENCYRHLQDNSVVFVVLKLQLLIREIAKLLLSNKCTTCKIQV